jgi:uncharacterized membrane protein
MNTYSTNGQQQNSGGRDLLATGLGWFSIGVGLAEIFASREIARLIGVRNRPAVFGALGARQLLTGIGILMQRKPTGWLWSRVAGDLMDLSLLGVAFTERKTDRERVEATAAAVGGVMVADVICALRHSRNGGPVRVEKVIAIDRPPEELYRFWRQFDNLPRFMRNLESVRVVGQNRSRWIAKGPAGSQIEWEAEIVDDRPNEMISWRSLPGADIDNSGSVRFERAPGGRGTVVRVRMQYDPPGGIFGTTVANLLGDDPETLVQRDLYRFKQVIEMGQVTTTAGQSVERSSGTSSKFDTDNTRK